MLPVRYPLTGLLSLLAVLTIGCSAGSPTQPSGAGSPAPGVPTPVQPQNFSLVGNATQPVMLVVHNASASGSGGTTYTFEVATDAGFASDVQKREAVPEGASGETSVTLDPLSPGRDYYWRARAERSGVASGYSSAFTFTVGPAIALSAPTPVAPLTGTTTSGAPTLTVNNAARAGSAGVLVYRFEIAGNGGFDPILASGTQAEASGRTSLTVQGLAAPVPSTLYWRVVATDPVNSVSSEPSAVQSFVYGPSTPQSDIAAALGVVLWPGQQPSGAPGHAVLGPGWGVQNIVSFGGTPFRSPPIEELQIFDLLDRGFDPDAAIAWMYGHGYSTTAAYYDSVKAIGFPFQYMALVNGAWELVNRLE